MDDVNSEVEQYRRLCGKLFDALSDYASPEFYHGVAFIVNRPAGGFADDWANCDHPDYPNGKPGALARQTIAEVQGEFGDLVVTTLEK